MKYDLQNRQPDDSYDLQVTAETVQDVVEMQSVMRPFNLNKPSDALAYAEAIQKVVLSRPLDHRVMSVAVRLKGAFTPYAKLLEELTGCNPIGWEMDLTDLFGGLHHHYVTLRVHVQVEDVLAHGYGIVWEKRKPADHADAERSMADYLQEKLGWRKHEPEFREIANGQYQHNPKYLNRYMAEPGLGSPELWDLVFDYWRKNHASPGQREVLDKADALAKGYEGHDYTLRPALGHNNGGVYGSHLTVEDPNGKIDWDGKGMMVRHVSWEKFSKL